MKSLLGTLEDNLEKGYLGDDIEKEAQEEAIRYSNVIGNFIKLDDLTKSNIVFYNNGVNVQTILSYLENGTYVFPGFQRRFVWDNSKIAYLALSLIQGVPIPPIYLYMDEDRNQVILDGQQRIISLFLYFNDLEYCRSDHSIDFKMVRSLNKELREHEKNLANELEGDRDRKKVKELNEIIKRLTKQMYNDYGMRRTSYCIEKHDISFCKFSEKNQKYLLSKRLDTTVVESRNLDIVPHRIFANIFKLLNSGGKVLGPQEVRNGIYWKTPLYSKLYAINAKEDTTWRKIYGKISDFSKDMEILLKILALNHYTKLDKTRKVYFVDFSPFSWSNIMDEYSEERAQDAQKTEMDISLLEQYLSSIAISDEGDKKLKCQKAVFEAMFVAYSKLEIPQSFSIPFEWLCHKKFEEVLSNKQSVETRINFAVDWLRELYNA